MLKDKKKHNSDADGESPYDIERKTQEAYRKGDLDLLDSLERILQPSSAYLEKFLYRRNEIQARSIDSIIRRHSLFVGVGAAHLPGQRGVIELLRRKGYTLRPIRMPDRDALQRDDIDKVKVPVSFSTFTAEDNRFTVQLPGKLYKRTDGRLGESWQYADMSNGAYYMITRVKTHSSLYGQSQQAVLRKIDSLLFENVPGKILEKKPVLKDGYPGFVIRNKTRRGDLQRYEILVTPFEILVFKMSGNGNYVEGREAEEFFSSIDLLRGTSPAWAGFEPTRGGFQVEFPQKPFVSRDNAGFDGVPRWEYEAIDSSTGDAYLVWKKSIQNYRFLDEDSFDLGLMEESLRLSDPIDRQQSRKLGTCQGYPCLDARYLLKDGSILRARFIIRGAQYFLLAAHSGNLKRRFDPFFDSFRFTPFRYANFETYADTFVNIRVTTPVIPDIDINVRKILERATSEDFLNAVSDADTYWPRNKTALFQDDSTGEAVYVSVQTFPRYFFPKDSAHFWIEETNENKIREDLIIRSRVPFRFNDSVYGIKYEFADTNSSRIIRSWMFVKDNRMYRVINLTDTLSAPGPFVERFYSSLKPLEGKTGESVFRNKLSLFFSELGGHDSGESKRARDAIPNVYFGAGGVHSLLTAIRHRSAYDREYMLTKTKLINELGYIRDSTTIRELVAGLQDIYSRAGDTIILQNAVLKALAKNRTRESYALLKTLILRDPPVFDNGSDYGSLFQEMGDSLSLARGLFPELLELSSVDDYKDNVRSLLGWLVDSGYLHGPDYESYFNKIYFDARIQLKKQWAREEEQFQKKNEEGDGEFAEGSGPEDRAEDYNELQDYAVLLLPFYESHAEVPSFFRRLLSSRDPALRLNTAILLVRRGKAVPDSIVGALAAIDHYRAILYDRLNAIVRLDLFPKGFRNQTDMARAQLLSGSQVELSMVEPCGKKFVHSLEDSGYVYFFRYKLAKDAEWQIGISGLQPLDSNQIRSGDELVRLTNKKIRPDRPLAGQFEDQLRRLLFSRHKSAASFYLDNDSYNLREQDD
jgi:hypothetical protein